ncbi:MAG TPA: trypsin-like peptidase domain-containing protein [Alphaproteobacteria bacterium]
MRTWLSTSIVCILLAAVTGCAKLDQVQSKVQGTAYTGKTYSVLYDQGDDLKSLVSRGDFQGAAELYGRERSFFRDHADTYKDTLDAAAAGLNARWQARLDDANRSCARLTWPAPRADWPAVKRAFADCRDTLVQYQLIALVSDARTLPAATALSEAVSRLTGRFVDEAPALLAQEDVYSGDNFLSAYPVRVDLAGKLVEKLRSSFDASAPAAGDRLLRAAGGYASESGIVWQELRREAYDLMAAQKSRLSLREMVQLHTRLAALRLAPEKPPVTVALVTAASATAPFQTKITSDVPFDVKEIPLSQGAAAIEADYVVAIGVTAHTDHKMGNYQREKSRYKAGEQTVANPAYIAAVLELQQAQNAVAASRAAQIQGANDVVCNAYGCRQNQLTQAVTTVASIAAQNRFAEAAAKLRATPPTIIEPVFRAYAFDVATVSAKKDLDVQVFSGPLHRAGGLSLRTVPRHEQKDFKVAYNISDEDTTGANGRFAQEEDVKTWEKSEVALAISEVLPDEGSKHFEGTWAEARAALEAATRSLAATNVSATAAPALKRARDRRFDPVVVIHLADGLGSGFFVTPKILVTNHHVVDGQKFVQVKAYDGTTMTGTVEADDPARDLAIVRVDASGTPVHIGAGEIVVGSTVDIVGHPEGLFFSLTRGIVSQVREGPPLNGIGSSRVRFIQVDAPVNHGNSGGPVYENGEVIGVVSFKYAPKSSENLNFAIHRDELLGFLHEHGISP